MWQPDMWVMGYAPVASLTALWSLLLLFEMKVCSGTHLTASITPADLHIPMCLLTVHVLTRIDIHIGFQRNVMIK